MKIEEGKGKRICNGSAGRTSFSRSKARFNIPGISLAP